MAATTLTVVSCLHRHASLDSMREVETFQPLASLPTFGGVHYNTLLSTDNGRQWNDFPDNQSQDGLVSLAGLVCIESYTTRSFFSAFCAGVDLGVNRLRGTNRVRGTNRGQTTKFSQSTMWTARSLYPSSSMSPLSTRGTSSGPVGKPGELQPVQLDNRHRL
ncbi:hypothetical protein MLPF_2179 [Mycobacterium lepromatosis]|nr:hypothetical protein MLPF_2179 [Mycobacterium lepromatosis]